MSAATDTKNFDVDGLLREARQSMSNFDINAILRGAQLTIVGGTCRPMVWNRVTDTVHSSSSLAESGVIQV